MQWYSSLDQFETETEFERDFFVSYHQFKLSWGVNVSWNGYLSVYVSPVRSWELVHGAPQLLPKAAGRGDSIFYRWTDNRILKSPIYLSHKLSLDCGRRPENPGKTLGKRTCKLHREQLLRTWKVLAVGWQWYPLYPCASPRRNPFFRSGGKCTCWESRPFSFFTDHNYLVRHVSLIHRELHEGSPSFKHLCSFQVWFHLKGKYKTHHKQVSQGIIELVEGFLETFSPKCQTWARSNLYMYKERMMQIIGKWIGAHPSQWAEAVGKTWAFLKSWTLINFLKNADDDLLMSTL